jgi:predicted peptidase
VLVTTLAAASAFATAGPDGGFVADSVILEGRAYRYSVYLPPGYESDTPWPVLLALHGAGSRGLDGKRQRSQSVVAVARRYPSRYPAILVLPQCPPEARWTGVVARAAWSALERTMAAYTVDSTRIYLAGQSMGADGVLELAALYPERVAAVLAVALGRGDAPRDAAALRSVPVRIFHGTADPIPVERARARVTRLSAAGHRDVALRELQGHGHEIFDLVYADATVSAWLFRQRRLQP